MRLNKLIDLLIDLRDNTGGKWEVKVVSDYEVSDIDSVDVLDEGEIGINFTTKIN